MGSTQQKAIDHNIIPGLFQLSGMSTTNKLGNFAENILDALSLNNEIVGNAIQDIKSSVEDQKKERAKAARERILEEMKKNSLPQDPQDDEKESVSIASQFDCFEDLEDEVFSCKVCREGYLYMPKEILGFYVFVKKVSLGSGG